MISLYGQICRSVPMGHGHCRFGHFSFYSSFSTNFLGSSAIEEVLSSTKMYNGVGAGVVMNCWLDLQLPIICNQYLSPLTLWVWIPLRRGVLDPTLCDKVCQRCIRLVVLSGYSTKKTYCHNITEILLKVALNTISNTVVCHIHFCTCTHLLHPEIHKNKKVRFDKSMRYCTCNSSRWVLDSLFMFRTCLGESWTHYLCLGLV